LKDGEERYVDGWRGGEGNGRERFNEVSCLVEQRDFNGGELLIYTLNPYML